ncbi:MAG: 4-fold beta flower protein [Patescibacteria group bacterium]
MITIIGNDVRRGGAKIGWVRANDVYNEDGKKVGYFSSNDIYDTNNHKLGYIEGNYLYASDGHKIELDDIRKEITGGSLSDLERAAVRLLLGD